MECYTEYINAAFSTLEVKQASIYPFFLNKPNIKSSSWAAGKTSVRHVMYECHFEIQSTTLLHLQRSLTSKSTSVPMAKKKKVFMLTLMGKDLRRASR